MAPSGQWTRICAVSRPHRSQVKSPPVRGFPRRFGCSRSVSVGRRTPCRTGRPTGCSPVIAVFGSDPGANRPIVPQIRDAGAVASGFFGTYGAGVDRGLGEEVVGSAVEDVAQGSEHFE